jgi:hypothetical protein
MQKYAPTFRICNNDQNPSKYAFAYAHMHFQKIRALDMANAYAVSTARLLRCVVAPRHCYTDSACSKQSCKRRQCDPAAAVTGHGGYCWQRPCDSE